MDRKKIFLQVTAYADNELHNGEEISALTHIIESDSDVRREYLTQIAMKRLVASRNLRTTTPPDLRSKILRQTIYKKNFSLFDLIFVQPAYSISFIIVGIVVLIGLSIAGKTGHITFNESGDNNIVVQAGINFNRITEGKLAPQLLTGDPTAMKNYFHDKGVEYNTYIPKLAEWKMLGCVVSEEKGSKFAHHVYTNENGKLLYVYQADQKYFGAGKSLKISPTLMRYINGGKYYLAGCGNFSTVVVKVGGNICTIVSNEKEEKLKACVDSYLSFNRKL